MTDTATFENTYVKYPFAPLVAAVLMLARAIVNRRTNRNDVQDTTPVAGAAA